MLHTYARAPLRFHSTIPVFSERSDYTDNYERISRDHLEALHETGANPFIPETLWLQTERSTEELVKKYARPGDSILDVGVGPGRVLERLPELRRYGMDISLGYLEEAQRKGIEVCFARIEDMPYRENLFDVAICTDVLEHVLDLNLCCSRILSVLRPGGILIVRSPYKEDLSWYASPDCPYQYVHLRTFDVPSLVLLFEKALGCTVLETVTAGYLPQESRRRLLVPFPDQDHVLSRLQAVPEADKPFVYAAVLGQWYEPIEINAVVLKPGERIRVEGNSPGKDAQPVSDQARAAKALERQLQAELAATGLLRAELARTQAELAAEQSKPWWQRVPRRRRVQAAIAVGLMALLVNAAVSVLVAWVAWVVFHGR